MFSLSMVSLILATVVSAISINTLSYYPAEQDVTNLNVPQGYFYSTFNYPLTRATGNARIDGKWYLTSSNGKPVNLDFAGGTLINNGLISVSNSAGSPEVNIKPSTILKNTGTIYVQNSPESQQKAGLTISGNIINDGKIVVTTPQSSVSRGVMKIEDKSPFSNLGVVCAKRTNVFAPLAEDNGCVALYDSDAHLYVPSIEKLYVQRVYFSDSSSSLYVTGSEGGKQTGIRLHGFGQGNKIVLDWVPTKKRYSAEVGYFMVSDNSTDITFFVGPDYDVDSLQMNGSVLTYTKPPPSTAIPEQCRCDFTAPVAPSHDEDDYPYRL